MKSLMDLMVASQQDPDLPVPNIFGTKLPGKPIYQVTIDPWFYIGNWKIREMSLQWEISTVGGFQQAFLEDHPRTCKSQMLHGTGNLPSHFPLNGSPFFTFQVGK